METILNAIFLATNNIETKTGHFLEIAKSWKLLMGLDFTRYDTELMAVATELCVLMIYIKKTLILYKLRGFDPFEL